MEKRQIQFLTNESASLAHPLGAAVFVLSRGRTKRACSAGCLRQKRSSPDYLAEAIRCHRRGELRPSLLPSLR